MELWVTCIVCATVIICVCTIVGAWQKVALKRCELWQQEMDVEARKVTLAEREQDQGFREYTEE